MCVHMTMTHMQPCFCFFPLRVVFLFLESFPKHKKILVKKLYTRYKPRLMQKFCKLLKVKMHFHFCALFTVVVSLHHVRGMLRNMGNNITAINLEGGTGTLRYALNQALQQNAELKSRLARIHREASLEPTFNVLPNSDTVCVQKKSLNEQWRSSNDNVKLHKWSGFYTKKTLA